MNDLEKLINDTIVEWANSSWIETAQSESLAKRIAEVLPKNKLHIFYDCLYDWTGGMAVALAETKEEAIDILLQGESTHIMENNLIKENVFAGHHIKDAKIIDVDVCNKQGFWVFGGS